MDAKFRDFFWPQVSRLVGPAIGNPDNAAEVLCLCLEMLQTLRAAKSEIFNLKQLSTDSFELLLGYTTSEVRLETRQSMFSVPVAGSNLVCVPRIRQSRKRLIMSRLVSFAFCTPSYAAVARRSAGKSFQRGSSSL